MAAPIPVKPGDQIRNELRTLDSKISLIGQKISTMEKNDEVLGRTLVNLNERVKQMEQDGGQDDNTSGPSPEELRLVRKELEDLRKSMVTQVEIKELKYILDTINPLEYATISQVRELIKDEMGSAKSKSGEPREIKFR